MAISQTRLDAMIVEQRTMFGSENLIINGLAAKASGVR
jgi:hypothetical protein